MDTSCSTFELKQLSLDDGSAHYALLQTMPADENGFMNNAFGLDEDGYRGWLITQDEYARGENMAEGHVPQTIYWLLVDGVPVGYAKLRTQLTPALRESGGHIGYGIASLYRGKGYATEMLRRVLDKARALGLDKVLLTIDPENTASRRVTEHCGGVLERIENGHAYYWITL